jgi:hypothetical protein
MRTAISKFSKPSEKLDFIFSHICNFELMDGRTPNQVGGAVVDFHTSFMSMEPKYFGLSSYEEMVFYLDTLNKSDFILLNHNTYGPFQYFNGKVNCCRHGTITFKGLNHLHDIENKGILSNKCFVAMAFDDNKYKRLDAIRLACDKYQFDAFIVDEFRDKETQTIDSNIISSIKSSNFCIADFTGSNNGVYLESGFAMGRNMKVIFTCEKSDFEKNKKHFDVNHYPFLCYSDFDDLTKKLIPEIGSYIK